MLISRRPPWAKWSSPSHKSLRVNSKWILRPSKTQSQDFRWRSANLSPNIRLRSTPWLLNLMLFRSLKLRSLPWGLILLARKSSLTCLSAPALLRWRTSGRSTLPWSIRSKKKLMALEWRFNNLTSLSKRPPKTVRKLFWACALSWPWTSTINRAATPYRSRSSTLRLWRSRKTVRKLSWACALSWPLTSTINRATTPNRSRCSTLRLSRPTKTARKLSWTCALSWPSTSRVNRVTSPNKSLSLNYRSTTKELYLLSKRKSILNKSFWSVNPARKLVPSSNRFKWRSQRCRNSPSIWMESSRPRRSPTMTRFSSSTSKSTVSHKEIKRNFKNFNLKWCNGKLK